MKKDLTTNRAERLPSRRARFFSPFASSFFDDYLDDVFSRDLAPFYGDDRVLSPAMDIDETATEYIVSADLPGIKKEDISIECSGNQLTVSGERKYESEEGRHSGRRERFYGSYERSFTLPNGVDSNNVKADFEGGVLTIHIPKGELAKSRRVEIGDAKKAAPSPTVDAKSTKSNVEIKK
ncbi:MAG: Hsp20/alpha crystallin family protein [Pseudobdellovibrio sp.]